MDVLEITITMQEVATRAPLEATPLNFLIFAGACAFVVLVIHLLDKRERRNDDYCQWR